MAAIYPFRALRPPRERVAEVAAVPYDVVSTEEARAMALRLAREEGLFAGTSTGANVVAALRLAEQLGPEATIVTVMCDTGMKYLKSFGQFSD